MPDQSVAHGGDATAANECHDQVYAVSRRDFRNQLHPESGLSRRIGHQGCVKQRNDRRQQSWR